MLVIWEKQTRNPFLQFSGSAIVYRKTYVNATLLRDYDYGLSLLLFYRYFLSQGKCKEIVLRGFEGMKLDYVLRSGSLLKHKILSKRWPNERSVKEIFFKIDYHSR